LLGLSLEWSGHPEVATFRYESLVADPLTVLKTIGRFIGIETTEESWRAVIAANTIESNRRTTDNQHFWQGRPGLWHKLITAALARQIWQAHRPLFEAMGYECDPDEELTAGEAAWAWQEVARSRQRSNPGSFGSPDR
jgi:hypothetical protein